MTFRRQTNRERLLKIREEAARPQDPAEDRCPECGLIGEHAEDCENAVDTELAPESGGDAA
jgi:hypothetical protein